MVYFILDANKSTYCNLLWNFWKRAKDCAFSKLREEKLEWKKKFFTPEVAQKGKQEKHRTCDKIENKLETAELDSKYIEITLNTNLGRDKKNYPAGDIYYILYIWKIETFIEEDTISIIHRTMTPQSPSK